jgi:hypothetical protein
MVSYGPCKSQQEAVNVVCAELNSWIRKHCAQAFDSDVSNDIVESDVQWNVAKYSYTRDAGACQGSAMLQALIDKFGHLTNAGYCAAVGLIDDPARNSFGSSFPGLGLRRHRVAIAVALNQLPSILWPGRSIATLAADDAAFVAERVEVR